MKTELSLSTEIHALRSILEASQEKIMAFKNSLKKLEAHLTSYSEEELDMDELNTRDAAEELKSKKTQLKMYKEELEDALKQIDTKVRSHNTLRHFTDCPTWHILP